MSEDMSPQLATQAAAGAPEVEPADPYTLSPSAVQAPPPSVWAALRRIGPGLILAGSIVGTGELIATTNTGAQAGFALLWLVILSCFIKVFVQIELGRYAVSSGETTLAGFCRLPGPGFLLSWWWLVMMLVTQTQIGAMIGGVGQAFHLAMPSASPWVADWLGNTAGRHYLLERPELPWAVLITLVTIVLLARGSYAVVESSSTVLVVTFTVITAACVVLLPATAHPIAWKDVAAGFGFHIPSAAVMAAFAMFGITGVGANELIAYPYWCIEKGYARNVGPRAASPDWTCRARGWVRVMHLDAAVCMLVYTTATVAFYLLGAAALHVQTGGKGLPSRDILPTLSNMYKPVMGAAAATWFIVVGAFAVLYSTLISATAANARTLTDFLKVNQVVVIRGAVGRRRWVQAFCVIFPLVGFALYLWLGNPVLMVTIGGIVQALTLPLIAAAAVYLRYRHTDSRITPGLAWDLCLWLSFLALLVAAGYGMWDQAPKLLDQLWIAIGA